MTDKIAEVALALAHKKMPFTVAYSNLSATDTEMLREEAKAAIEAYRDPTDEMIQAALIAHWPDIDPHPTPNNGQRMRLALQAAADAALEGK